MNPEELTILNIIINEIRDASPLRRSDAINDYKAFMDAVTHRLALKHQGYKTWAGDPDVNEARRDPGYLASTSRQYGINVPPSNTSPFPGPSVAMNPAWTRAEPDVSWAATGGIYPRNIGETISNPVPSANGRDGGNF